MTRYRQLLLLGFAAALCGLILGVQLGISHGRWLQRMGW